MEERSRPRPAQAMVDIDGRRFAVPARVPHLTPAERAARGKAARAKLPRSSHAVWEPVPGRPDPIALLEEQAETRVPDLVPIRYGRMLASHFAFFRGAAYVMAADLASTPHSGLQVQLCGDAHLTNFGGFATPERRMTFDINDFDETLPGPWEWDLKRLAASFAVAARERGFRARDRRTIVTDVAEQYRLTMRDMAAKPNLDVWYEHVSDGSIPMALRTTTVPGRLVKRTRQSVARARTRDSMQAFQKLTRIVEGEPRIVSDPPLIVPYEELIPAGMSVAALEREVRNILRGYRRSLPSERRHLLEQFRYVHLARKVVGVGSVGTRAWVVLLLGRDGGEPLFLQVKEAEPSVLEHFIGPSRHTNHGQRVVAGQRLMQAASDIFLGWYRVRAGLDGRRHDYYVRQLRDWKLSADPDTMDVEAMLLYGRLCSWTLARAHARSGDRIAIASYLGTGSTFDRALAAFAELYADQNERDHAALVEAVRSGRIQATTGL
jgi:uncharacterized protein (DUF2252 family)